MGFYLCIPCGRSRDTPGQDLQCYRDQIIGITEQQWGSCGKLDAHLPPPEFRVSAQTYKSILPRTKSASWQIVVEGTIPRGAN